MELDSHSPECCPFRDQVMKVPSMFLSACFARMEMLTLSLNGPFSIRETFKFYLELKRALIHQTLALNHMARKTGKKEDDKSPVATILFAANFCNNMCWLHSQISIHRSKIKNHRRMDLL